MMPNITRGQRMGGLMAYLAGPGRANEHVNPRVIAGDQEVTGALGQDWDLDRSSALDVAATLDQPRRLLGVEVAGGHVWHCSLSLAAAEGELSDEKWAAIANEFVAEMGFTDAPGAGGQEPAESGKAPCRWAAVRHGVSKAGNDHIHIAVSLVREDGTKASVFNDRKHAQRIAGELEVRHDLVVLESRQLGYGARGISPAEQHQVERQGLAEAPRTRMERQVRACAATAGDEAGFVQACRASGLMVRPRFAAGTRDVVEGYSVALHPRAAKAAASAGNGGVDQDGETGGEAKVVWFGGGKLGRDLTLPRLREQWADSAEHTAAAVMEWSTGAGTTPAVSGASGPRPRAVEWEQVHSEVGAMYDRLRSVPTNDTETWTRVARETAGVLSAWSEAVEDKPGPLADAARDLGRCAQVRANPGRARRVRQPGLGRAAVLITQAVAGSRGPASYAILAAQLIATVKALRDHQAMAGRAQSAALMEARVVQQLEMIAARLPRIAALDEAGMPPRLDEGVAASMAAAAAGRGASPDAPVPARLRRPAPVVGAGGQPRVPGQSTGAGPRRGLEAPARAARTGAKVTEVPLGPEDAPRPSQGPQQGP